MGHIVSESGLKPDPSKVEAIDQMPTHKSKQDLQHLLGMVKYFPQYIPNESSYTALLRQLLKQDAEWIWQHEYDEALNHIKKTLIEGT